MRAEMSNPLLREQESITIPIGTIERIGTIQAERWEIQKAQRARDEIDEATTRKPYHFKVVGVDRLDAEIAAENDAKEADKAANKMRYQLIPEIIRLSPEAKKIAPYLKTLLEEPLLRWTDVEVDVSLYIDEMRGFRQEYTGIAFYQVVPESDHLSVLDSLYGATNDATRQTNYALEALQSPFRVPDLI